MNKYTYFTLTHFDCCDGETFSQDYRWSWQTCPYQGDKFLQLEANAGDDELPDWIFEEGLGNERGLRDWIKQQEKENASARKIWADDLAREEEEMRKDVEEFLA